MWLPAEWKGGGAIIQLHLWNIGDVCMSAKTLLHLVRHMYIHLKACKNEQNIAQVQKYLVNPSLNSLDFLF